MSIRVSICTTCLFGGVKTNGFTNKGTIKVVTTTTTIRGTYHGSLNMVPKTEENESFMVESGNEPKDDTDSENRRESPSCYGKTGGNSHDDKNGGL